MNTLKQAAQKALYALEDLRDCWNQETGFSKEAITALREALKENEMAKIEGINMLDRFTSAEQAKQEPVAYISRGGLEELKAEGRTEIFAERDYECAETLPLYAAPVRTKDLTPYEITALIRDGAAGGGWQGFAQRVIAADREKQHG